MKRGGTGTLTARSASFGFSMVGISFSYLILSVAEECHDLASMAFFL